MPGNYLTTSDFGTGYDAVLLSGMMHRETGDTCRLLLRKSFEALEPGGLVRRERRVLRRRPQEHPAVRHLLRAQHDADERARLGARQDRDGALACGQPASRSVEVRELPPPNPHTLVIGIKP